MKKITTYLSVLILLGNASCKKSSDKLVTNSWTTGDKTYHSVNASLNANAYTFTDANGTAISFMFSSLPASSNTYNLNVDGHPGTNEVDIITAEGSRTSVGISLNAKVAVTVEGTRINFKCSAISLFRIGADKGEAPQTLSADLTYTGK